MTRLDELLRLLSVRTGRFTLRGGAFSDLYVDVRQTSLHPEGAREIARAILAALDLSVAAIGGVELGAVPIVGSMLMLAPVDGFIVRKQTKIHGTGSRIERPPASGTKVAIIEDCTTTGRALVEAIVIAREAGLDVIQAITVVDREEGAAEALRAVGLGLTAITTRTVLLRTV